MTQVWAKTALTSEGWQNDVRLTFDENGVILALAANAEPANAFKCDILLPALGNLHSHAFQRAMAGLTEARASRMGDDFWSWRTLMYRFLEVLDPSAVEAIAAQVQMEMLEAGYASIGEFHYLHNQVGGVAYDQPEEMSARIFAAAAQTGIGLTHLPVYYTRAGMSDQPLEGGQLRFRHDLGSFVEMLDYTAKLLDTHPQDYRLGLAPHSLRAVTQGDLKTLPALRPDDPVHIHIAEQIAEVQAVQERYGARPIEWLAQNLDLNPRWCLVHATHMTPHEIQTLAQSGAIAGLCPITEANLGDGVFAGADYLAAKGMFGIGSDSNVRISLSEELRLLEYSQRLTHRARNVMSGEPHLSVGRTLYEGAAQGGARALGRKAGRLSVGQLADMIALDGEHASVMDLKGDTLLDGFIFAGDDRAVREVWSAGRHMVKEGRHIHHDAIEARFKIVMRQLRQSL
ncbi:formimidoylglutamate deiminase [Woodsholea maritima]|uniref:formimidoylglutamate deiminase n=1 Tax=Woodsholea maritima TaxID=240237 RepID=UPI00036EC5E5|nr:formimidoylglutamate deiminase [Woodsholea maritima]